MADVTIESSLVSAQTSTRWINTLAYTTKTVGYIFYIDSTATLVYKKTSDSGATWGSSVNVSTAAAGVEGFGIWPGRNSTSSSLIHIVWYDQSDRVQYKSLDPSSDTLSSAVSLATGFAVAGNNGWVDGMATIIAAQGGNLYATVKVYNGSPGAGLHWRSTDGGVNWTSRTNVWETAGDEVMYLPANVSDQQDMCAVYGDVSANELSIKMYDDSGNSWTETAIGTYAEQGADYLNWDATFSPATGLVYVAWFNEHDAATADLKFSTIAANAHPAPAPSAKTNVLTDSTDSVSPRVIYDEVNGHLYVFYLRGTVDSSMQVYYKKSTDGGATWGSETTYAESAAGNFRTVDVPRLVRSGDTGRIAAAWRNDGADDYITGVTNSIAIEAAAAGPGGTGNITLLGVG